MFDKLLPMDPGGGPPLPQALGIKWPWVTNPDNPASNPAVTPNPAIEKIRQDKAELDDEYIIVMKKKPRDPVWLRKYHPRFAAASKLAAEQTKHLKGAQRVIAMNQIIAEALREQAH